MTTPAGSNGPPIVYAAIGGSETVGEGTDNPVRDAWPQVLFRSALPTSAAFVNFGIPGVTLSTALSGELPEVLELHPNLVTVWLNVTDLLHGVRPSVYESQLRSLLSQLRAAGAKVLVANAPPLADLPAYAACADPDTHVGECPPGIADLPPVASSDATIASYNDVIARVATQEGAVVVDLHAAEVRDLAAGRVREFIGSDGLNPSTAGSALIAEEFAAALRTAGPLPKLRA